MYGFLGRCYIHRDFFLMFPIYLLELTNTDPFVFQMLSPGYSSDTAYVEFLNIEDAVHFMESNQVAHSCPSTAAVSSNKEGLGWGRAKGGIGWSAHGRGTWEYLKRLYPLYKL